MAVSGGGVSGLFWAPPVVSGNLASWLAPGVLQDSGISPSSVTPGGSNTQLQYNNSGAFGGISGWTTNGTTQLVGSGNGAASTPPMTVTGAWFTGGSATTTKPQILVEPSGTTSTGWSTSGTGLGVNGSSGFAGNLLDLQVAGVSQAKFTNVGDLVLSDVNHTISWGVSSGLYLSFKNNATNILTLDYTFGVKIGGGAYLGFTNSNTQSASPDLILSRAAAAALQLGSANAASPVAQTLQAQGSRSGTDTNVSGANLTIASGQGTGNAAGSSLIFQTPAAVASGSGAQTMTTALTITGTQQLQAASGSKTSPTYSFGSATGSGWYWRSGVGIALAGNSGKEILQVGTSGTLSLGGDTFGLVGGGGGDLSLGGANTVIYSPSAAVFQFGGSNAASPIAQTLQTQGSRSGTDSNVGGANLTITSGNGTGTGTISSLILQSPIAVASGSGAQTQTTGLTIKGGQAVTSTYTVSTLPTGIAGGVAYITDGDAGLAWGATAINSGAGATKYLVWYNNANWTVIGK